MASISFCVFSILSNSNESGLDSNESAINAGKFQNEEVGNEFQLGLSTIFIQQFALLIRTKKKKIMCSMYSVY